MKRSQIQRTEFQRKLSHKGLRPSGKRMRDWRRKHEKGSRKRLIEDLDEIVSLIVRKRDNYRCVLCGSTYEPQASHIFKRGRHATRWDLQNVWTNCSGCNKRHNEKPDIYIFWFVKTHGSEAFAALRDRAYSGRRFTDSELEALLAELKETHGGVRAC